jgi:peptide/nickel transport system substrate-binding protein
MESRFVYPFQPAYAPFVAGVGGQKYDTVDIARARTLLAGRTPTVRIGWRKDPAQLNKRRADTVALIKASCAKAGFKVVDAGSPTFFSKEWPAANYDVAMFGWTGSPTVTGSNGIYQTAPPGDPGNNPGGYSNKQVDLLTAQLSGTIDKTKQLAILKRIDTLLWNDLNSIPLFTFPAVLATAKNVGGVTFNASQADLTWNVQDWTLS